MLRNKKLLLLSLGHGLNDFVAGYLLGHLFHLPLTALQVSFCFLIYNILAFGGQYFAALWLSPVADFRKAYLLVWALNLFAILCFQFLPEFSLVAAGCASAVYHVAGGSYVAQQRTALPVSFFAAPGIIGLSVAGYLSYKGVDAWLVIGVFVILFFTAGFFISLKKEDKKEAVKQNNHNRLDKHDVIMLLLLLIITARSALWNVFQLVHVHNYTWLLAIAGSAFIGKIFGGWVSDKLGWAYYNFLSLGIAMPLVSFFKQDLVLFCIGIAFLQSGIPASTTLLLQHYPHQKEKAIAFSFGVAVITGGVITILLNGVGVDEKMLLLFGIPAFAFAAFYKRMKKSFRFSGAPQVVVKHPT